MELTIGMICTILGAIITYITFFRNIQKEAKEEASSRNVQNVQIAEIEINLTNVLKKCGDVTREQTRLCTEINTLRTDIAVLKNSLELYIARLEELERIHPD